MLIQTEVMKLKNAKKLSSFRLSQSTKDQIKDMARGLDLSEADVIAVAVGKLFKQYDDDMFKLSDEINLKYLK